MKQKTEIKELYDEFMETDFYKLRKVKLLDIDFDEKTARVKEDSTIKTVPIKMHDVRFGILSETGNYYGIDAYLDPEDNLTDYSYISDVLTPVGKVADGVDVYE